MEKRRMLFILLLLPFFIFMSSVEEGHSSGFIDFLGKAVNFIILFGGLTYILFKPIRNFLEKRSKDIENSLKDAEESKEETEQKVKEVKDRLSSLENETTKIMKESELEGHKEKEKIIQLAQKEAEKIKYFAKQEIEMLIQAGIQDLKEYTAELASAIAEERIRKRMSPEGQSILINKAIKKLDKLYERSNSDKEIHSRVS
ncbi:MAG: F0F1 ATP synthase subunit B [Candidatus Aminicenantes bacterium]|nr:F0F1 ATP synthase subunit B [Candidatus Aminicenantes bacterium]MBL7083948.1 F0F1 ATP synthase subunit B [Candidatus Aminicenantes bacterium]